MFLLKIMIFSQKISLRFLLMFSFVLQLVKIEEIYALFAMPILQLSKEFQLEKIEELQKQHLSKRPENHINFPQTS